MSKQNKTDKRFVRICLTLYPFVTAAVAINLFMLGLAGEFLSLASLAPLTALFIAIPLGLPFTFLATRWVQKLIADAEG